MKVLRDKRSRNITCCCLSQQNDHKITLQLTLKTTNPVILSNFSLLKRYMVLQVDQKSNKLDKYDWDNFPYSQNNVSAHNHLHLLQFKSDLRSTAYQPDDRAHTSFVVKPPTLPISASSDGSKTQETEKQEREITSWCCKQAPCPQRPAECYWDVTWGATYHQHYVTCNATIKHKPINRQEGTGVNFLKLEKKQFWIVSKNRSDGQLQHQLHHLVKPLCITPENELRLPQGLQRVLLNSRFTPKSC